MSNRRVPGRQLQSAHRTGYPSAGSSLSARSRPSLTTSTTTSSQRRNEESSAVGFELLNHGEHLPRPVGDLAAEVCYNPDLLEYQPKSPASRLQEDGDKRSGRQFLWPTTDAIYARSTDSYTPGPIPLAVVCSPFADGAGEASNLPFSDTTSSEEPLRCPRCRSYLNSYFQWVRGDQQPKLKCNMCDFSFPVPESLKEDMEQHGQCADEDNHPELVFGSLDFSAACTLDVDRPSASSKGPPRPALCVVIETTVEAKRRGLSVAALAAVADICGGLGQAPMIDRKVCVITFDAVVHFHGRLKSGRTQAVSMLDVDDPYLPLSPDVVFLDLKDPTDGKTLAALLDQLQDENSPEAVDEQDAFDMDNDTEVAGNAALRAAIEALSQVGGGDLLIFHGSMPTVGIGSLSILDGTTPAGSPNAASPASRPTAASPFTATPSRASATPKSRREAGALAVPRLQRMFFEETLALCLHTGIAVSCVTAPAPASLDPWDIPALTWLPMRTGGDSLHIPNFMASTGAASIANTMRHWAEKMQVSAYGCVVKLRCSKGLKGLSLLAPWPAAASASDGSAFEVCRLSPDTSFSFLLETEPEREPDDHEPGYMRRMDTARKQVYVQLAVLHTNGLGERLLRVHNVGISVLPSYRATFPFINVAPLMSLLIKQAVVVALEQGDNPANKNLPRDILLEYLIQLLVGFIKFCQAGDFRSNMLILGRNFQLLPLYILSARKLLYTATNSSQDRAVGECFLKQLLKMPVHSIMGALYPRVYSLPSQLPQDPAKLPSAGRATARIFGSGQAPAYLVASTFGTWFYQAPEVRDESTSSETDDLKAGKRDAQQEKNDSATIKGDASQHQQLRQSPEHTPERRIPDREELWRSAEALSQRIRERLAPGPTWMPLQELPRLPEQSQQALDLGVSWNDKILLSSLFVEDEGITEMSYNDWVHFVHSQVGKRMHD